jgi:hypothetical protein
LLEAADLNKDNLIQFEEFLRWTFGGGGEQEDFQEDVELEDLVKPVVTVVVRTQDGHDLYGPIEMLGAATVGLLRRRVTSETGCVVACLCNHGCVLRESLQLGVYATDAHLELTVLQDGFSILTDRCISELTDLGALATFLGQCCLRIGWGGEHPRYAEEGLLGVREEHGEMLLLSNGQVMVKGYSYNGIAKAKESSRVWKYEMAEGTYSIMDPTECFIEICWNRWAERTASDENKDGPPSSDILQDWVEVELDEFNHPSHLLPASFCISKANVLHRAKQTLAKPKHMHLDDDDDPQAGVPMPGIDERVLSSLSMDVAHVAYWLHGAKSAGPQAFTGKKGRSFERRRSTPLDI